MAFVGPLFLQAATQGGTEALRDFIPSIKQGVVPVELCQAALKKHFDFCKNAIGASVNRLGSVDATIAQSGHARALADLLATAADGNDATCLTSTELTKAANAEGRCILVTSKEKLTTAKKVLDNFTQPL